MSCQTSNNNNNNNTANDDANDNDVTTALLDLASTAVPVIPRGEKEDKTAPCSLTDNNAVSNDLNVNKSQQQEQRQQQQQQQLIQHHQQQGNDVMQAILNLQTLRSSAESLPSSDCHNYHHHHHHHDDDDDDCNQSTVSYHNTRFSSRRAKRKDPPHRNHALLAWECQQDKHRRKSKELESLQQVWFLNEGNPRRKRKYRRDTDEDDTDDDDNDNDNDENSSADTSSRGSSSSGNLNMNPSPIQDDDDDDKAIDDSPTKERRVLDETLVNNSALGDLLALATNNKAPIPSGAVIDLVARKYENNVFALFDELDARVVQSDATTANAYKFSATHCPRGKSTIWRICCELKGQGRVELSAWWRKRVQEYKQIKRQGKRVYVSDKSYRQNDPHHHGKDSSSLAFTENNDRNGKPLARMESTSRHGTTKRHTDNNMTRRESVSFVPAPQPIPALPEETNTASTILHERKNAQESNNQSRGSLVPKAEFVEQSQYERHVSPAFADDVLLPWRFAVAVGAFVFLSLCGPVALILTLYVHFVPCTPWNALAN